MSSAIASDVMMIMKMMILQFHEAESQRKLSSMNV